MTDTTDNPETVGPVTVNELLGSERGVWCVVTRDSSHYFDLDNRTVVRVPGRTAHGAPHGGRPHPAASTDQLLQGR